MKAIHQAVTKTSGRRQVKPQLTKKANQGLANARRLATSRYGCGWLPNNIDITWANGLDAGSARVTPAAQRNDETQLTDPTGKGGVHTRSSKIVSLIAAD